VLHAEGREVMLTIDARAQLDLPRTFTDEELSDLVAAVIDAIEPFDPQTSAPGEGTTPSAGSTDPWQVALCLLTHSITVVSRRFHRSLTVPSLCSK
jgi:hypothetical protein